MAHDAGPAMARRGGAAEVGARLQVAGGAMRYGLAAILLYYGAFKVHPAEAEAIRPLVSASPFMGCMYAVLSVRGVSALIGAAEIAVALLLRAQPWSARARVVGGAGAVVIFLATLSFLATTPGVWERVPGWPVPKAGAGGAFLFKDLFLPGAAVGITGESLRALARPSSSP